MSSTSNLLDIFTKLVTALECPVCYEYVSSPIYQCNSGHILCNKCISSIYICPTCRCSISPSSSRVRSIEHISDFMIFPCRNEGCEEIMPLKELQKHENRCRHANAFGGTINENYKHTSLKHKLFLHVEQNFAPFFVTCPSVVNVDVGIQTENETGLTAEASTSANFPPQNAGPYLMYGIMQPAEQFFKSNDILSDSSQQFCGFVSPSSSLMNENFVPTSIVNNFTDIIRKNSHLLNLSSNDTVISSPTNLFDTASSSNNRIVTVSQSVDGLNLKTDLSESNKILFPRGANNSVHNEIKSSSLIGVKPSYLNTSLFSIPAQKSENISMFTTGRSTISKKPPHQRKTLNSAKSSKLMKNGPKEEFLGREDKFSKTFHTRENHSPLNKMHYKGISENNNLKSLRGEHEKCSHKSNKKKFFQNRTSNHLIDPFSFQGFSNELSKVHDGFSKEKNVFCFSGIGNSSTISKNSNGALSDSGIGNTSTVSNNSNGAFSNSGKSIIFTSSNSSFGIETISSNSKPVHHSKELGVNNLSTRTIAARSCDTSVTFSVNSSITSPIASTSGTIPASINFDTPSVLTRKLSNNPPFHPSNPPVSPIRFNTLFCNPGILDAFSSSTTLVTSNSQTTIPVSDGKHSSLCSKASFIFGDNSPVSSNTVPPKLPVVFNSCERVSDTLSRISEVDNNISSVPNLCVTGPVEFENNSKPFLTASTSFNPIIATTNFKIPCSTTPINTSASLFIKNPMDSEKSTKSPVEFSSFNQNQKNPTLPLETSSTSLVNFKFSESSQINSPYRSFKNSDSGVTPLLFNNFLKQFNKRSTNVKGFNFGLNPSATDPMSPVIINFSFSKEPTLGIPSEDIFLFGNN